MSKLFDKPWRKIIDPEVRINIIHGAVGAITRIRCSVGQLFNAIVIGFNVRPAANVADMAKETGVDLRMYRVIYHAIEDIEAAMKGLLAPQFEETILGHAEVRQVFRVSGVGSVAGCYVTDGKIHHSSEVRIVRMALLSMKANWHLSVASKMMFGEVAAGYECGMGIERFNDIENDIIEAFEMTEIEG